MKQLIARITALIERVTKWVMTFRVVRVFMHFSANGGNLLAAGLSFQAIFALFAALYVGFATFGIVISNNAELQAAVVEWLNTLVPGLIGPDGATSLDELLQAQILGWTGAIAAVSLVWVAVGWLGTAREAIRRMMGVVWNPSNGLILKVRDFGLAFILAIAVIISAGLMVLSSSLLTNVVDSLGLESDSWIVSGLARVLAFIIMFVFDAGVLAATYRVLSGVKVNGAILFRVSFVGGLAMSVIMLLGSQLASGVGNNPLLASFATLIGLLVWFNLLCRVVLLGAAWIAIESEDRFGSLPGTEPNMGEGAKHPHSLTGGLGTGPGVGVTL
ncbi:YihY/virulence factor BrkB family protein [Lysinibacter cavernae]|uniref:Membrane protein n=1 Tax=Lysinibacter cavernae TaxID=1640652 RepID=A0A7X5TVG7_9MICO|nr:YhjD/YihY/BrkB family envelope integrity protein [Lysinibacter cavernae]NIH55177.1 membrane protein [Lysinibacter cavernae]